jgi:hypothetical protein
MKRLLLRGQGPRTPGVTTSARRRPTAPRGMQSLLPLADARHAAVDIRGRSMGLTKRVWLSHRCAQPRVSMP